jgi:hypothetical protein
MAEDTINTLAIAIEVFLDLESWEYSQLEDGSYIMDFAGDAGQWRCMLRVREVETQVVFYALCPVNCPEERYPAMMEFLTRANYGMVIGNFEMDLEDGEMRFKASIDLDGGEVGPTLIRNMVWAGCAMMDRYLPGILQMITGATTALQAITAIESEAVEEEPAN